MSFDPTYHDPDNLELLRMELRRRTGSPNHRRARTDEDFDKFDITETKDDRAFIWHDKLCVLTVNMNNMEEEE